MSGFQCWAWSFHPHSLVTCDLKPVRAESPSAVVSIAGRALPIGWFDGLATVLSLVGDTGIWPEDVLDADIVMIPT